MAFKIGFKLETSEAPPALARDYLNRYSLSHLVMNQLQDVSAFEHKAQIWQGADGPIQTLGGKEEIARYLAREAKTRLLP